MHGRGREGRLAFFWVCRLALGVQCLVMGASKCKLTLGGGLVYDDSNSLEC